MSRGHLGACLGTPGPCICADSADSICYHQGAGWHRTDRVDCLNWDEAVAELRALGREVVVNGYGHSDADYPFPPKEEPARPADGVITLDDITVDPVHEGLFHRPGCSIQRNDRCICAYLNQWPMEGIMTTENSTEGQECVKALAEYTAKQGLNLPIVIASGVEDPNEVAIKIVRDNPQWFGELPDGLYQKPDHERELQDEKLRTKYWHKEYLAQRRRWWWAVSFAAACTAATGTVLAWAWAGVL